MPTTQADFDAFGKALYFNFVPKATKILRNFDLTATDRSGTNCLGIACWLSHSTEVIKLVFEKIDKTGGPGLLISQLAATNEFGKTCLHQTCDNNNSSSPDVLKLVLAKIIEAGGMELLKSHLAATSLEANSCLTYGSDESKSPAVMKFLVTVLFSFDMFKTQYDRLTEDFKESLKQKIGVDSSSWTPDAASLAEVKAFLQGPDPVARKKKADEEAVLAKKKAEDEANVKKKDEEEVGSKTKAQEEAALAKRKAQEEAG